LAPRMIRPYPRGSSSRLVTSVAAAPPFSCSSRREAIVSGPTRGTSPLRTTTARPASPAFPSATRPFAAGVSCRRTPGAVAAAAGATPERVRPRRARPGPVRGLVGARPDDGARQLTHEYNVVALVAVHHEHEPRAGRRPADAGVVARLLHDPREKE